MKRRQSQNWAKVLVLSIFVFAAALVLVAAWRWFGEPAGQAVHAGAAFEFPLLKCRYVKPNSPWEVDSTGIKQSLKAVLVMRRTAPQAWLALLAKDYKSQSLRDSEFRDEAVHRMAQYFDEENLEWTQGKDAQLAGRSAQRLVFRGEVDKVAMSGECYGLANRGIAYWFLTWAPADQIASAQDEFEELRRRFTLLPDRKNQAEERPAPRAFHGHKIPYTLQDRGGLWQEWTPATDYDLNADLALVAHADSKTAVAASVVVLVLGDPRQDLEAATHAAKAHVEAGQKVAYPETAIDTVAEKVQAPEPSGQIGNLPGRVVQLHVRNGETRHRFILLGVIRLPDQLLVLQCESAWQQRVTWEPLFQQLLGTLRLAKE